MPFDLEEVVNDSDLAESFTIQRNPGFFGQGGWSATTPQLIGAWGVVTVATPKDLTMFPEADWIVGNRMFISSQRMQTDSADQSTTADILIYNGSQYKVKAVAQYGNHGYWCAVAPRMAGN